MLRELHLGDCLEVMGSIPEKSVDLVLCDPPYGTTACKWDSIIPLDMMWDRLRLIIKTGRATVLTAGQPFTTTLISSNLEWFRYTMVWEKDSGANFLNANFQPLKVHEDIVIFSDAASSYSPRGSMIYNPQKTNSTPYKITRGKERLGATPSIRSSLQYRTTSSSGDRHPRSVVRFNKDKGLHPTQKPIALIEYLVKTYSNEGDTVLDFCMGSGTTGVACKNLNRNFIGIEKDPIYFKIAEDRIAA
jgi:site-specific DNA-methyltransferase (adenine-specific)